MPSDRCGEMVDEKKANLNLRLYPMVIICRRAYNYFMCNYLVKIPDIATFMACVQTLHIRMFVHMARSRWMLFLSQGKWMFMAVDPVYSFSIA